MDLSLPEIGRPTITNMSELLVTRELRQLLPLSTFALKSVGKVVCRHGSFGPAVG